MTKTAIIEYNEVLKKLSKKSKRLLRDMQEAVKECDALARGEIVQETTYEEFLAELKQIAENRNHNTANKQKIILQRKINTVIPVPIKRRQKQLYAALQKDTITPKEHQELILLNDILEQKMAERILLMGQLANLNGISIQELVAQR